MKKAFVALVAIFALTLNTQAIELELALCIDGSGSISSADFALQKQGYINGLTAHLVTDGSVAIGVWQFASNVVPVYNMQVIDSEAKKNQLLLAIQLMSQIGTLTAIGDAITAARNVITANAIDSNRQLIDVSTDGYSNTGSPVALAAANAVSLYGIDQVNGLFVGTPYDASWVPAGSLVFTANSFADFDAVINQKLYTELVGVPEAGSTIILLGMALLGLGAVRRR